MNIFDIIWEYKNFFKEGLKNTLFLIALIYPIGLFLGSFSGIISHKYKKNIGIIIRLLSVLVAATPILVILFWLHYPFQYILEIVVEPIYTAVFAISLVCTFLVSDIIFNAINDFPNQYISSAKVCGLNNKDIVLKIQFPLILRQILPSIINILVIVLQMTLFASLISVNELFRVAQQINAEIYRPVEIYTAVGIFYAVISLLIFGIAHWFKLKFTRNISES